MSKAVFDRAFAVVAFVTLGPVLAIVSLLILLREGRPVFFGHERVGLNGRTFRCWKFRTMVRDADTRLTEALKADPALRAEWHATRKLTNDPRISPLGHFLRKSSLDELPQFWNVLIGDMSMVGPRPVVRDEMAFYGKASKYYCSVRPGLTGAWQVSGRSNTTYDERVALDVEYVQNASFWGDVKIVLKTVHVVLAQTGAR